MANSDIQLLFSVLGGGSLSGESGSLIQSELTQIMDSMNKNPFKIKVALDASSAKKSDWTAQLQKKLDAFNAGNKLSITVSNIKLGNNAISSFKQQLGAVINTLNIDKDVSVSFTSKDIGEITTQFKSAGDAASDAAKKAAEFKVQMEALSNLKSSVKSAVYSLKNSDTVDESVNVQELIAKYESWAVKIEEVRAGKVAMATEARAALEQEGTDLLKTINGVRERTQADEKRNSVLKQSVTLLTQMQKAERDWTAAQSGRSSASYSQIQQDAANLEQYILQLRNGQMSVEDFQKRLAGLRTSFADSSNIIRAAGENTKTFTDRIGGLAKKFTSWLTVSQIVMRVYQALKQMVTAVIEVDTAMTELRKVTDETEQTYAKFLDTAISRSKELGATVADTVNASADFARLGYSLDDAAELADAAIIYKNVGDGIEDISMASESIISTMKAFGIAAEDSMLIVDKFNQVGNNFAISSKGVGDALVRSASALAAANNTLDESIALITAANSVVQDADKVGTTLKTVSMFLRAAKTEAEAAGESTEGMANSVSELRSELLALTGNKVDIQIDEDTFKSTYQIMKELSAVWDELTDISQANILEMIGGKRNSNVVASLIENFETAEQVIESTANAAGSAIAENEKYLASIQGRIDLFKASFEAFSLSIINSNLVKVIIDIGTGLLNVLTFLQKIHVLLPMIVASVAIIKGISFAKQMAESAAKVATLTASMVAQKGVTDSLAASVAMLNLEEKKLLATEIARAVSAGTMDAALAKQILSTLGLATAEGTLTVANKTLAASFKSVMASIPVWGWIALGISVVIEVVSALIPKLQSSKKSIEELDNEFNELSTTIQTLSSEFTELSDSAEEIIPRFAELAQGVDKFGNNISLTDEEYAEFVSLNNTLADMFPDLVRGYDINGNAILNLSGNVDTLTASLYDCVDAQKALMAQEIADTMSSVIENIVDSEDAYKDAIRDIERDADDEREAIQARLDNYQEAYEQFAHLYDPNTIAEYKEHYGDNWEKFWDTQVSTTETPWVLYLQQMMGTPEKWQALMDKYGYSTEEIIENGGPIADWGALINSEEMQTAVDVVERELANLEAGVEREIADYNERIGAKWQQLNPIVSAWLQTDFMYQDLNDTMREIAGVMVSSLDFSTLGLTTEAEVQQYINDNILEPLFLAAPKVKDAFKSITDWREMVRTGVMSGDEFATKVRDAFTELLSSMDEDSVDSFKSIFVTAFSMMGVAGEDFETILDGLIEEWAYVGTAATKAVKPALKSFEKLESSAESAVKAQIASNDVFADNASLTQEAYEAIVELAGGEEILASCIDTTNGYLVTNAAELQKIIGASNEVLLKNIKMAASHEKLNYHNLVSELHDVCNGLENYDDASMSVVDSILEQIDKTELQIAKYKLLEQQVLGVTNAFTELQNAQSYDDASDYTDDLSGMIESLIGSFESHEFGTEAFQVAFEGLIPEDIYEQFTDAGEQLDAGWAYLNEKLSRYFTYDDGSISIDYGNVEKFVSDALSTAFGDSTVLTGTLEDFDLNPQITTVEEFADAMGVTTEVAFALGNAISKYTVDNADFLSELEVDSLEGQIYECDQRLLELLEKRNELGKAGEIGTEEWDNLQLEIESTTTEMEELQATARENITAHIAIDADILEKQRQVDELKTKLESLDETDPSYSVTLENYLEAEEQLAELLRQKYGLEAPTELTIWVALEAVQGEIDGVQQKLDTIAEYDAEAGVYVAIDPDDQLDVDALVGQLATLKDEYSQIQVYAGIDDEDVLTSLETIQNFVIEDKDFSVSMSGYGTTKTRLDTITELLRGIRSKTITITTNHVTSGDSDAYGTARVAGSAHARGNWGLKSAEKNALVGELGTELVVDPNSGMYHTVGENGAELVDLPKGAIIFNHKQTEGLLKNRRINSRGTALAQGNAHFTYIPGSYKFGTPTRIPDTGSSTTTTTITTTVDNTELEEQLEETLEAMADKIDEIIGNFEHQIFIAEKNGASSEEIIAIYEKMQEEVHRQANEYRALGLDENSDYIQDLQKQWWEYEDAMAEVRQNAFDDYLNDSRFIIESMKLDGAKAHDISRSYSTILKAINDEIAYYLSKGYDITDEVVQNLIEEARATEEEVKEALDSIVSEAQDAVDKLQDVYTTLSDAADEYADYGYITVDTLQDIIGLGVEYMAFLQDENGQLVINKENIQKVVAARTEQLAVESALNYVEQLRLALEAGNTVELQRLLTATTAATGATWGLVYASLALLNLDDDQYAAALNNINALRSLADNAIANIGVSMNSDRQSRTDALEEQKTALEDILDYTMELIEWEAEQQVEALEEQISDYEEIVELKKEMLQTTKEESDYEDELADKIKAIAKLQERINALSLDDSRDAQAERVALEEEMAGLQEELADFQADHMVEAQENALDDMAEAYATEKEKEIAAVEATVSSTEKIYQLAIERISNDWDGLYQDLLAYNYEYGSTLQQDIVSAWNAASLAVQEYGSYVAAVNGVNASIDAVENGGGNTVVGTTGTYGEAGQARSIVNSMRQNSIAYWAATDSERSTLNTNQLQLAEQYRQLTGDQIYRENGSWYTEGGNLMYSLTANEVATAIVSRMKANSAQWSATTNTSTRAALEKENETLAARLASYLGASITKTPAGEWYINGEKLYNKYHSGGIAGDIPTLKQDEVMAILQKGEAVLDKRREEGLFKLVDFVTNLSERFGKLMSNVGYSQALHTQGLATAEELATIGESKQTSVAFGDVYIYGANDATVEKHREVNRQFVNDVLKQLNIKK